MYLPIFLSFISAIGFAITNVTIGQTGSKFPTLTNLFYRNIVTSAVFGATFLVSLLFYPVQSFDTQGLWAATGIGLFGFLGLLAIFKALSTAPIGLCVVISNTSVIYTILTNYIIFNQPISLLQIIGVVISLCGIVLITKIEKNTNKPLKGLWFAVLNSIIWGITFTFYKYGTSAGGAFTLSFIIDTIGLLLIIYLFWAKRISLPSLKPVVTNISVIWLYLIIAMGAVVGVITRIFAQTMGSISVTESIITAISPIITLIIARIWLKEKLVFIQYIGALVVLIGVICVILC